MGQRDGEERITGGSSLCVPHCFPSYPAITGRNEPSREIPPPTANRHDLLDPTVLPRGGVCSFVTIFERCGEEPKQTPLTIVKMPYAHAPCVQVGRGGRGLARRQRV